MPENTDSPQKKAPAAESVGPAAESSSSRPARKLKSVLPEGFRLGVESTKARVSSISVALDDRDHEQRQRRTDARLVRERRKAGRRSVEVQAERLGALAMIFSLGPVFLAPLAIGGVHLAAIGPLALISLAGVATAAYWAHVQKRGLQIGVMGWALVGMTLLTLFKCLPLPLGVVEFVAPTVAAVVKQAYLSVGEGEPAMAALSLNPAYSAKVALGFLAATSVYITASTVLSTKERFQRALLIFSTLGLVLVVVGVLQNVAGGDRLFFYAPEDLAARPFFTSTFVNPNHLAALLGLVSFAPLGLSLSKDFEEYRVGLVVVFVITVVGMVMTLSVPAMVAWGVGLVAFGVLSLRQRFSPNAGLAYGSLAVLFAFAMGIFVAWTQLAGLFTFVGEHQGLPWLEPGLLWPVGWNMATSFLLGTGPGAFGDLLAAVVDPDVLGSYRFVGNHYLQLAIDYGLPVAVAFVISVSVAIVRLGVRTTWKLKDASLMAGVFASSVFVAFEALTSFSLEIPGVLLPAVFILGLGRGRDARYTQIHQENRAAAAAPEDAPAPSLLRRFGPAIAVAVLVILALPALPLAVDDATQSSMGELKTLAKSESPSQEQVTDALRRALAQDPASGETQLVAAVAHQQSGRPELGDIALDCSKRFNRANPAPYVLAGRRFVKKGNREAALAEYRDGLRFASRMQGPGANAVAAEIARNFDDPNDVATAMPEDPEVWEVVLRQLMRSRGPERVKAVAAALLERFPADDLRYVPLIWAARAELELGELDSASKRARGLIVPPPGPSEAYLILTSVELNRNNYTEAFRTASEGLAAHPDEVQLEFHAAEILLDHPEKVGFADKKAEWDDEMKRHLRALRPAAIRRKELRYRFYMLAGRFRAATGQTPTAIRDLQRAAKANPDSPMPLLLLVELEGEERNDAEVLRLYRELLARFPNHPRAPEFRNEIDRIEDNVEELRKRFDIPDRTRGTEKP